MQWFIPAAIHPIFVHFAIALSLFGVALDAYAFFLDRPEWHRAAKLSLACGVLAMATAALAGWWDHERWHDAAPHVHGGGGISLMTFHQYAGWSLLLLFSALLAWRCRLGARVSRAFLTVASVGVLGVLVQGHIGGQLVFRQAVGVQLPQASHAMDGQPAAESGHPSEADPSEAGGGTHSHDDNAHAH